LLSALIAFSPKAAPHCREAPDSAWRAHPPEKRGHLSLSLGVRRRGPEGVTEGGPDEHRLWPTPHDRRAIASKPLHRGMQHGRLVRTKSPTTARASIRTRQNHGWNSQQTANREQRHSTVAVAHQSKWRWTMRLSPPPTECVCEALT
jgi:hypothetical protein